MKHWFLSDIHLTDINERNGNHLLRFFHFVNKNPLQHSIYLLGDIFDFWLSDGKAFQKHYSVLIQEIQSFKNQGGVIYYFEGNHDFHVDRFWTDQLGIPVIEDGETFLISKFKVRLEHGDFINPLDHRYLNYRKKVRRPWVEWIAHTLPGFFWKWFGEKLSQNSRKKTSQYAVNNYQSLIWMIRNYSKKIIDELKVNIVITGHMHVFDVFDIVSEKWIECLSDLKKSGFYKIQFDNNSAISINLGTWLDQPLVVSIENEFLKIYNLNIYDLNSNSD